MVRKCVVIMCRHGGMRRQGVMCGQEMGRRNVSSGHVCAVRNVSSQCVVSVTAKSDTQDAGALHFSLNHGAYGRERVVFDIF